MQHAAIVRRGHAGAQLPRDLDGLVLRNAADAAKQRGQVFAVDVLHRQEGAAVRLAEVVDAADVPVRYLPGDAQLVVEVGEPGIAGHHAIGQELQRDRLIERQIVGAVDLAHAAAAQQGDEPITSGNDRSWRKRGRRQRGRGQCRGRQRTGQERRERDVVRDGVTGPVLRSQQSDLADRSTGSELYTGYASSR